LPHTSNESVISKNVPVSNLNPENYLTLLPEAYVVKHNKIKMSITSKYLESTVVK